MPLRCKKYMYIIYTIERQSPSPGLSLAVADARRGVVHPVVRFVHEVFLLSPGFERLCREDRGEFPTNVHRCVTQFERARYVRRGVPSTRIETCWLFLDDVRSSRQCLKFVLELSPASVMTLARILSRFLTLRDLSSSDFFSLLSDVSISNETI